MATIAYVPVSRVNVSFKKLKKLSNAKVRRYIAGYEAGDDFPPITVEDCGNFYTVRDGRHRLQAQLACGYRSVEVSVYGT